MCCKHPIAPKLKYTPCGRRMRGFYYIINIIDPRSTFSGA